jgi:hypothetical protein
MKSLEFRVPRLEFKPETRNPRPETYNLTIGGEGFL